MSGRADVAVTTFVLLSIACAVLMPVLFATGNPYAGTGAGLGACYCVLLAVFLTVYAEARR